MIDIQNLYKDFIMNQVEDVLADVEMYFCQLIDLLDLMIENDNASMNNFMTLKQLSESGLNSIKSFKN